MFQKIPVGIEDFKEMIEDGYRYVDKTDFIADTFQEKVAFYTRPRRFGKTLNMSMLNYFYSIKEKKSSQIFASLKISENSESKLYQNQFPVISITMKGITDPTFDLALERFSSMIRALIRTFPELLDSSQLDLDAKNTLKMLRKGTLNYVDLSDSLLFLSECLCPHYHKKAIILIDEYDVPLHYAYENGYYDEMVRFMRSVLSQALKSNHFLEKGILTGCLRISKESIFTGLSKKTKLWV